MRINIIKEIDSETREVWGFNWIDISIVFVEFCEEIKPKGKRKWTVSRKIWNVYSSRDSTIPEPVLPGEIRLQALEQALKYIKVKTWSEYKK